MYMQHDFRMNVLWACIVLLLSLVNFTGCNDPASPTTEDSVPQSDERKSSLEQMESTAWNVVTNNETPTPQFLQQVRKLCQDSPNASPIFFLVLFLNTDFATSAYYEISKWDSSDRDDILEKVFRKTIASLPSWDHAESLRCQQIAYLLGDRVEDVVPSLHRLLDAQPDYPRWHGSAEYTWLIELLACLDPNSAETRAAAIEACKSNYALLPLFSTQLNFDPKTIQVILDDILLKDPSAYEMLDERRWRLDAETQLRRRIHDFNGRITPIPRAPHYRPVNVFLLCDSFDDPELKDHYTRYLEGLKRRFAKTEGYEIVESEDMADVIFEFDRCLWEKSDKHPSREFARNFLWIKGMLALEGSLPGNMIIRHTADEGLLCVGGPERKPLVKREEQITHRISLEHRYNFTPIERVEEWRSSGLGGYTKQYEEIGNKLNNALRMRGVGIARPSEPGCKNLEVEVTTYETMFQWGRNGGTIFGCKYAIYLIDDQERQLIATVLHNDSLEAIPTIEEQIAEAATKLCELFY